MPATRSFAPCRSPSSPSARVLLALTDPTQAAETARRLKIDLEVKRDGTVQQGAEQGRGKLVQQLSLSVVLTSDGTPMVNNPLDPEDGRRQLERAQRTQQKVQAAQAKVGYARRPRSTPRRCRRAPSS